MPIRDLVLLQFHSSARELTPLEFPNGRKNARLIQSGQLAEFFTRERRGCV